MGELYIFLIVAIIVGTLLVLPYVHGTLQLFWNQQKWGIRHLVGDNTDQLSKRHLLYVLSKAVNCFDVCTGSLRADIWNQQVADAIERRLRKHPRLRLRILTGPVLDGFIGGTHPVFEKLIELQAAQSLIEIRSLKGYPLRGQGKHADNDLYVELEDDRNAHHRRFVAFYEDYLPDPAKVDAWMGRFDSLWDDRKIQLDGLPPVEYTQARLDTEPQVENAAR